MPAPCALPCPFRPPLATGLYVTDWKGKSRPVRGCGKQGRWSCLGLLVDLGGHAYGGSKQAGVGHRKGRAKSSAANPRAAARRCPSTEHGADRLLHLGFLLKTNTMGLFRSFPGGDGGFVHQIQAIISSNARLIANPVVIGAVAATMIMWPAAKRLLHPTLDPREPPAVQPTIPIIGHIISMLTQANDFYNNIAKRSRGAPICTLPMLAGKLYVIYSPAMIQAAMRSRDLSFMPVAEQWSGKVVGMEKEHLALAMPHMERLSHIFWTGTTGDNLARLNEAALGELARVINAIPGRAGGQAALRIPNIINWVRKIVSLATFRAVFGDKNPLGEDDAEDYTYVKQTLYIYVAQSDLRLRYRLFLLTWEPQRIFENNFAGLAIGGPLARIIGYKAYNARARVQKKLLPYMLAGSDFDESASDLIRMRAESHGALGIPPEGRAKTEFLTPWLGTLNTIPTLVWFFTEVFSRPDMARRVRDEVLGSGVVTFQHGEHGERVALVRVAALEKDCPYLMACYRETLRTSNENVGIRMALVDTVLRDPEDGGREYLLKAGTYVQWSAATTHKDPRAWGPRPNEFNPDNFLDGGKLSPEERTARRLGMIPFGGGKHLCPGRFFAQAENLSIVAALAAGFDIHGAKVPGSVGAPLGAAARQPVWSSKDPCISISRRQGWEDVVWKFECSAQKQ